MPRSSRRSRNAIEDEDEEEEELAHDEEDFEQEEKPSPRKKSRRSLVVEDDDEEEEEEDGAHSQAVPLTANSLALCSQAPEITQEIVQARDAERNKFLNLSEDRREKAVADVLRLVLFKGLAGDPIDRLKIAKDTHINEEKITGAVFEEVNVRLENLFALKLQRVPAFLENMKDFSAKYKDRYYLINTAEDPTGDHLKSLHMVNKASSMEKGLLMAILGFVFCKGVARSDGSRWLLDKELYRLLHSMDENLPPEPPVQGNVRPSHKVEGIPDVDGALDRFVKMDYLFRLKANEQLMSLNDQAEETSQFYAMGTRAFVEIGRLQVVHFIAQTRKYANVDDRFVSQVLCLTVVAYLSLATVGEEVSQEILDEINNEDEADEE